MYDKSERSANIQHPASILSSFQKMNLERRLLGMLRLGNYPKRYLKISFFWELILIFSRKYIFISFQKQSAVAAHSVCGFVLDSDCTSAASAYLANERDAQGECESVLTERFWSFHQTLIALPIILVQLTFPVPDEFVLWFTDKEHFICVFSS